VGWIHRTVPKSQHSEHTHTCTHVHACTHMCTHAHRL
jgi:hypothetical protein